MTASRKPLSSLQHGLADYPAGVLLVVSPWLFGFDDVGSRATLVPVVVGIVVLLQSLVTDYELSLVDRLPMRAHLGLDVVAGVVLALSPLVLGTTDDGTAAWLPHVVLGLGLLAAGLLTRPYRETERPAARSLTRAQP